jgi:MtrB/PioB family decaheme-associated outer membrane protein
MNRMNTQKRPIGLPGWKINPFKAVICKVFPVIFCLLSAPGFAAEPVDGTDSGGDSEVNKFNDSSSENESSTVNEDGKDKDIDVDTPASGENPENTLELAYIYLDNPNGKLGEYNGFDEDNHYVVLGLDWFLRNEDAPEQYGDVEIHHLGLATFFIKGEYGKQGDFRLRAGYDQLQKVYHDEALTIYDDDLNELPEPRDITTRTKRKTASVGFDKFFGSQWELKTDFRTQQKDGQRPRPVNGGLIVPQNIDFRHDEFDASLTYANKRLQLAFGSYFSGFKNADDLILGTAAEPDNHFYQLSVNGGYTFKSKGRITGFVGYSKGKQDDLFSRYGIENGTYSTDSLNARYDTLNVRLDYRHKFTRKFGLDVNYRMENRNNDTALYSGFPSDKNNKVYEWDKQKVNIVGRYSLPARWRLRGGLQFAENEYEVNKSPRSSGRLPEQAANLSDETDEVTAWAEIRSAVIGGFYGNLKYAHSDRDADIDPVREEAATVSTGGVALSFYLIPRVRDRIDLLLSYSINQSASLAFTHTTIEDDYDPIAWASLESRDISTSTLDFTWSPNLDYSLSIYAGIESYEIEQSGYGSLGNESSRWAYDIDDDSVLFGVSGKASAFSGKIEFRLDYRYQKGEGDYETIDPSQVSGSFPDLSQAIPRYRKLVFTSSWSPIASNRSPSHRRRPATTSPASSRMPPPAAAMPSIPSS